MKCNTHYNNYMYMYMTTKMTNIRDNQLTHYYV